MKRVFKENKKGFTLVEMVLVIAIIVILAAVMILGIGRYIADAEKAASKVQTHVDKTDSIVKQIQSYI